MHHAPSITTTRSEAACEAATDLCGQAMCWPETVLPRYGDLSSAQFPDALTASIWAAIVQTKRGGQKPTPPLVAQRLQGNENFIGLGVGFLANLLDKAGPPGNAASNVDTIRRDWQGRKFAAILAHAADHGSDPMAQIAKLKAEIDALEQAGGGGLDSATLTQAATGFLDALDAGKTRGLSCGLSCVDRRWRGLQAGKLNVIAARPSMGKTALARNILHGAAIRNPKHAFPFFSLEMTASDIAARAISALAWAQGEVLPYEGLHDASQDVRRDARKWATNMPANFQIFDRPSATVDMVRQEIWRLKSRGPVGAVVIDYLGLMGRPEGKGLVEASIIGQMTSSLKRTAMETGTCIVLLAQLNRQCETREDKRPLLSDLRESGSIEQDADSVTFVYRDAYYATKVGQTTVDDTAMEAICRKNRAGPIGTDLLTAHLHVDHIEDSGACA